MVYTPKEMASKAEKHAVRLSLCCLSCILLGMLSECMRFSIEPSEWELCVGNRGIAGEAESYGEGSLSDYPADVLQAGTEWICRPWTTAKGMEESSKEMLKRDFLVQNLCRQQVLPSAKTFHDALQLSSRRTAFKAPSLRSWIERIRS